jgi:hypothetical protein
MKLNEEQLESIIDSYVKLNQATEAAIKAGCLDVNGPLFEAIWHVFENVLAIVDQHSCILWYIHENDMGKKELSVTIDSKNFKVKTTKTLLGIINL